MEPELCISAWKVEAGGIQINLATDLSHRLQLTFAQSAEMPPAAGKFGILIGSRSYNGKASIDVMEFETVWSGHAGSPLSKPCLERLPKVLASLAAGPPDAQPVGFFRTLERMPEHFGGIEIEIAQKCFRGPGSVFLIVASSGGDTTARLWFRDRSGAILGMADASPFPFADSASAPALITAHFDSARFHPAPYAPPGSKRHWMRGALAGSALVAALCGATYVGLRLGVRSSSPSEAARAVVAPSALTVQREGTTLRVTWNRAAPIFNGAKWAIIFIVDGYQSKAISLDLGAERGELFYSPASGDIEFRLRTMGETERTESARFVDGRLAQIAPGRFPLSSPSVPDSEPGLRTMGKSRPEPAAPNTNPQASNAPGTVPAGPAEPKSLAAVPSPPAIEAGAEIARVMFPIAEVEFPASPQPGAGAPARPAVTSYIPARVLQKVVPTLSPFLLSQVRGQARVSVKTNVDETGRVVSATVTGSDPRVSTLVSDTILRSARLWRFDPAEFQGKKIPSELTIVFRIR